VERDVEQVIQALIDHEVRCVELVDDPAVANDLAGENPTDLKPATGIRMPAALRS
jgi:hypothetical protein